MIDNQSLSIHCVLVFVSFVSVDLPRDPQTGACISSYVEIGDATSPRVVCGEEAQPYTSPGYESRFTMTFFTGSISQAHGFKVSYVVGKDQHPVSLIRTSVLFHW